jgi:hypothetical protein
MADSLLHIANRPQRDLPNLYLIQGSRCRVWTWPVDREQRARIIGDWLRAETRFLA